MQLSATLYDASGKVITGQSCAWSSSNTSIATVSSGLVLGVASGSATITANSGGATAVATVTVSAGSTATFAVNPASFSALSTVGGYGSVGTSSNGVPVGVCRTGTSTYVAYSLSCTHAGTTVNTSSVGWTCPNHGAQFSSTGAVLKGPATTNLISCPVTVNADGTLSITVTSGGAGSGGGGDD